MEQVLAFLETYGPLDDRLREYLLNHLRKTELAKGTILVKEGSVAGTIGFIEKGVIRGFRTLKGDSEKTNWFMVEGDVFASVLSLFQQQPAREAVQTLEPCIIHTLRFDQYKAALKLSPSFQRQRAEILEKYYMQSLEREDMRHEKIYERFCYLMQHYPDLVGRVLDKYLASFIGTTPTYYSDVKRKYFKRHGKR
jgi:CRP/FNR family transcriptional regulator, anaerobic regulatory protein